MVVPQNGSKVAVAELLGGTATDSKNKALKFEQEKDTAIPAFTAKGKDGNTYGFSLADIVATVTVSPKTDMKALRRQGFPVDKNEAKKLDQEIKEEDKAAGKVEEEETETEDANPTLKAREEEKSGGRHGHVKPPIL